MKKQLMAITESIKYYIMKEDYKKVQELLVSLQEKLKQQDGN